MCMCWLWPAGRAPRLSPSAAILTPTLRIDSLHADDSGLLCSFSDSHGWLARRLNTATLPADSLTIRSQLLGRHHAPLLLAAVAVGAWSGLPLTEILAALAGFEPLPGHLRPLAGRHGALLLDDTVNASPASMHAALETLALFQDRLRVAVLGDMWDLGTYEAEAHRQAGRQAAAVADWLLVKGQRAQEIANGALDAGLPPQRIFRAYTDADIVRFVEELVSGRLVDWKIGQPPGQSVSSARQSTNLPTNHQSTLPPVILLKADRPARMERLVAGLLAEPERAGELLVRQSAGWLQVRPLTQDRPTWVEIDLEALAGNVRRAQQIVGPEVAICAVLKADGYGHGAASVARTALNNGARMLAVACLAEAVVLRRAAIDAPILVLGYTPAWQARDTVRHDVTATVYDLDVARALSQAAADLNRPVRVHVKVDTGMARLGLLPDDVAALRARAGRAARPPGGGHLHPLLRGRQRPPEHRAHTEAQLAAFPRAGRAARAGHRHSAGACGQLGGDAQLAGQPFRHGAAGHCPVRAGAVARHAAARRLPAGAELEDAGGPGQDPAAGAPVSYGNTFVTQRETRVAVAPVGYADGFRRGPAHWGHVLVRGRQAPIIGRVTMDQTMLDVTGIPGVRQGDEVVLIGRQGAAEITVEQVAQRLGTINYEVVAEILARVPRVI
jgi:Alr-MurF fusion protein